MCMSHQGDLLMGSKAREKPARLAKKLVRIRQTLDLSQDGMIRRMGVTNKITREDISKYERGLREPSLLVLLEYARAANVSVETLIDDELNLPEKLPANPKSERVGRLRSKTRRVVN
jgi:transcriptional regulator with XRE-family HTH domain